MSGFDQSRLLMISFDLLCLALVGPVNWQLVMIIFDWSRPVMTCFQKLWVFLRNLDQLWLALTSLDWLWPASTSLDLLWLVMTSLDWLWLILIGHDWLWPTNWLWAIFAIHEQLWLVLNSYSMYEYYLGNTWYDFFNQFSKIFS